MPTEERMSTRELIARWRALQTGDISIESERYELNERGDLVTSPLPTNAHQAMVGWILGGLGTQLGGMSAPSLAVLTSAGILVPDVAWMPRERWESLAQRDPLNDVPNICVEVLSPGDLPHEVSRRIKTYLDGSAEEVIIVEVNGKARFWRSEGESKRSMFNLSFLCST
jgi:Uma2 family endonuclease